MKRIIPLFMLLALYATSCLSDKDEYQYIDVNKEFYSIMQDYYYWYDQIPNINPSNYSSPYQLLEAIRVNPPDKWSYITTQTELNAYYNQASYVGFGFASGFTSDNKLMISLVYDSSPLKQDGVDRGWQIVSIDDQSPTTNNYNSIIGPDVAGVTKTFELLSPNGTTITRTYTKSEISTNTVFADTVFSFNSTKVGYFMLKSFVNPTKEELTNTFAMFKAENITELIVDLRYNGGGLVSMSNYLANLIGANNANGGIFGTYKHNDKHPELNENMYFKVEENSLSLNRVFFITTSNSASASELVINSLKPFMDVKLVGSNTHGKPVGMYQINSGNIVSDLAYVPICFSIFNAMGEGDYFNGLPANIIANDDIMHPFGSTNEECINAALAEIGVVNRSSPNSTNLFLPIVRSGLKGEIGSF